VPVEKFSHEPVITFEMDKDRPGFTRREDDRNFGRTFSPLDVIEEIKFPIEDVLIQKEQRAQRLVLCRGSYMFVRRKVSKKSPDFFFSHRVGMAFAVEENEASYPVDVGLLRANAVVLYAQMLPHSVEELGLRTR